MNNMNTPRMIISKEACLFYGIPGTVILAMSLILACKIGNDLGGSTFVCVAVFFVCNLLLWFLYLLVFQYLPVDLLEIWQGKKKQVPPMSVQSDTDTPSADTAVQPVDFSGTAIRPVTAEEYQTHCAEFARKKQEERQPLIDSIIDYVGRMMSPFLKEEELDKLRNEIRAWCDDPDYVPQPVKVKPVSNYQDRLKSISYKHFVWNIAVRLGFSNGYSVMVQANFIKKLFPDELEDIEVNSLARSLTCDPDKGHIRLDRPNHTDNNVFNF